MEFGMWSLADLVSEICFAMYSSFGSHRWLFHPAELQFLPLCDGENLVCVIDLLGISENLYK